MKIDRDFWMDVLLLVAVCASLVVVILDVYVWRP